MKNPLLIEIADYLKERLKDKLIHQDHVASKQLLNSIKVEVESLLDKWIIVGSNLHYGQTQDTGLASGTYVPIAALLDWIRAKNIRIIGMKELDFAWAVRTNIFKYGTPTDGDESKKRWISGTLEEEGSKLQQMVQQALLFEVELMVGNVIENTQILLEH